MRSRVEPKHLSTNEEVKYISPYGVHMMYPALAKIYFSDLLII